MSSQTARLWEAVLAALDSLADGANPSSESQLQDSVLYKNVWKSLGKVSCVPNSTWKRLVLDMQLPRRLGLFASSRLVPLPYASGAELPTAFAEVLSTFLLAAVTEEHEASAQVKAAILQQCEESGLFSSLDALEEATAQQLEQCLAAAAVEGAKGLHFARRAQLLTLAVARQLFIQEHLDYLTDGSGPGPHTLAASNISAVTHLTLTGMRHLSWCLQLLDQPPEQQQQQPPDAVMRLAGSLSINTVRMATVVSFASVLAMSGGKQLLPDAPGDLACTMGGHFLMWADLALLLVTYACAFDQHGHLPAVDDFTRRRPAAAAAAAADAVSSSSSSNRGLRLGRAGWQLAQGQWQHVPASHKQLLELFGVSTHAAVYVAALMPTYEQDLPVASACFLWNPHIKAAQMRKTAEKPITDGQPADTAYTPRQLQQWTNPALAELLQPVLLYGAAHAVPEDEEDPSAWIQNCKFVITRVKLLVEAGHLGRAATAAGADLAACSPEQAAAALAAHGPTPLPVTVRDDSLLLTVTLLQQLQQLRSAGSAASNSSGGGGSSSAAPAANLAAVAKAEEALVLGLEFLSSDLELALSTYCPGAASGNATAAWPSCLLGKLALPASACAADTEVQAAAAAELVAVWQQHLRAVYRALEGFVRAQDTGSSLSRDTQEQLKRITGLCCPAKSPDSLDQPHLLLALARRGSSEQQAAFFSLLVSLLKVSGRGVLDPGSRENSLMLVAGVAAAAYSMVMQTTLPAAAGGVFQGSQQLCDTQQDLHLRTGDGNRHLVLLLVKCSLACCWSWHCVAAVSSRSPFFTCCCHC